MSRTAHEPEAKMLPMFSYDVVETLHACSHCITHRVRERSGERTFLLRGTAAPTSSTNLDDKLELLEALGRRYRVVAGDGVHPETAPSLLTSDIGGHPLKGMIPAGGMPMSQALWIAVGLVELIQRLHTLRFVHKSIAAPSILVNTETREVDFVCLCTMSRIPREMGPIVHPERLEGALSYISPEQTGRMNRAIDFRSDFYSLGVTLYEMFTGVLPLVGEDPVEQVHAHIARTPVPPSETQAAVPKALSDIVVKLMSKNAEDRYQSCTGILHDLETCAQSLAQDGEIRDFEIARNDILEHVTVPQKLYGREDELEMLMGALRRVRDGKAELVLVSGYSGIGKTSLVQEIPKRFHARQGFFISGKHEQYQRNVPYLALKSALRDLMRQLLTENAERIQGWKVRLWDAVGDAAQLMVDLVPELELILGPQPPPQELPPAEAEVRFTTVFSNFIRVFAGGEHPLVVFLDDLQWVDAASLKLIRHLTTRFDDLRLLLVGSYRDNEVNKAHPLMIALDELRKSEVPITDIVLTPLAFESVEQLVTDTLRCSAKVAKGLVSLLIEKTGGNPFFLIHFLETLGDQGYVRFDLETRTWSWDEATIATMESTENVVALMVSKLRRLPDTTQDALRTASCIGNAFDLSTLSAVIDRPLSEVTDALRVAVQQGAILQLAAMARADGAHLPGMAGQRGANPEGARYRFLHDRVQQAALSLISKEARKPIHLMIGRLLLDQTGENEFEERLFDIVNQLSLGVDLIESATELEDLARLCLLAGQRAKSSTAYLAAHEYCETGVAVMGEQGWSSAYDLTMALHFELAECSYLSGQLELAEQHFAEVLGRATTDIAKARVYSIRTNLAMHESKHPVALGHIVTGLALLGTEIPGAEETEQLLALAESESAALVPLLANRRIADFVDLPEMTDESRLMETALLQELSVVGMFFNPTLVQVATLRLVRLSLQFGTSQASVPAYATYGMTIGTAAGQYEAGYAFGKMAIELAQRRTDPLAEVIARFWFGALTSHWRAEISESIEVLKIAVEKGTRIGAPMWTGFAAFFVLPHMTFAGVPLPEALEAHERYVLFQNLESAAGNAPYVQLMRALAGEAESVTGFEESGWDDTHIEVMKKDNVLLALQHYFLVRLMGDVLLGPPERALETVTKAQAEGDINSVLFAQLAPVRFTFFHALAILDVLREDVAPTKADALRERLDALRSQLETWAATCPQNFGALHALVEAELAALSGDQIAAMDLFEAAVDAGLVPHRAMASERAARFHLGHGRGSIGKHYLTISRDAYIQWGATAKAQEIETVHREHFADAQVVGPSQPSRGALSGEGLDMMSVLKAARIVSGEIELDKLLRRSMAVIIENAGAQRGVLLLDHDGSLRVEGAASVDPTDSSRAFARSIVDYCGRTRETVALDEARDEHLFSSDPYLTATRPRSVLAMPLMNKGQLSGVLYLENRITAGAFTSDRVQLLEALCAQLAVSLENARIYQNLDQSTEALRESEERLSTIYNTVGDTIFHLSVGPQEEYRFLSVNRAFLELTGLSEDQVVGKQVTEVLPETVHELVLSNFQEAVQKKAQVSWEDTTQWPAGEVVGEVAIAPVVDEGGVCTHLIGSLHDVTARKKAMELIQGYSNELEREVRLRTKEEKEAKDEAESANRAKDLFLANMSHEVRTPMNAILGFTDLALRTHVSPKTRDYLSKIRTSSHSLLGIINDILDLSKVEAGKVELELVDFELYDVMGRLSDVVGGVAAEKDIEFLVSIASDVPCSLVGDPLRLGQILTNLAYNAGKFTEHGEILVKSELIARDADRATIEFTVIDSGIGIEPDAIDRLFDPFTQADESTTREYGGSGLGLAICKHLVNLMGGEILVKSELGKGSTFSFALSFDLQPESEEVRFTAPDELHGMRVLVVDDNTVACNVFVEMLNSFSFEATAVHSGEAALAELLATQLREPYELVLIDWKMPGINGVETARRIENEPDLANHVPKIIMVTAYGREEVLKQAEDVIFGGFLLKPVSQTMLFETVMLVFGKESLQGASSSLSEELSSTKAQSLQGARILLVEDVAINREVAQAFLEHEGATVSFATNGREAVDAVLSAPFDAVLMDVQMPVMDGYEATRTIRTHRQFDDLPIIAMTAHAMKGDRERCLEAGMNDYVLKPIDVDVLLSTLASRVFPAAPTRYRPYPSGEVASAPISRELAGINVEEGLRRVGGNRRVFKSTLRNFGRTFGEVADDIRQAWEAGDSGEVRRLVHTIKGVSGNLSATELHKSSRALEVALESRGSDEFVTCLDAFERALDEVVASCALLESTTSGAAPTGASGTPEELTHELKGLEQLLVELDNQLARRSFEAKRVFESIRAQMSRSDFVELATLQDEIDRLDFESARGTLSRLVERMQQSTAAEQ